MNDTILEIENFSGAFATTLGDLSPVLHNVATR